MRSLPESHCIKVLRALGSVRRFACSPVTMSLSVWLNKRH